MRPTIVQNLPTSCHRVVVLGCAGSGKSTLTRRLGVLLQLPVVHLDRLFWLPGWKEMEKAAFDALVQTEASREDWIIDGNYNRTLPFRLEKADMVIYLDLPRGSCLWNVLWRAISHRGQNRPDMAPGCTEKVDWEFLTWIWNFNCTHREKILELLRTSGKPYIVLRSRKETARFLDKVAVNHSGKHHD